MSKIYWIIAFVTLVCICTLLTFIFSVVKGVFLAVVLALCVIFIHWFSYAIGYEQAKINKSKGIW